MSSKPWEVNAVLAEDRLINISKIVKDIRYGAVELYEPDEGDGPWSLGCRVYERTINAIERKSKELPWLDVIRKGLYFVLLVDGLPIRFVKGEVESPHTRTLKRLYPEIKAEQLAFFYDDSSWFWRLIVEPDENGYALRIAFVQYTENGNYRNLWEAPVIEPVSPITLVEHEPSEGVVLEKPHVAAKYDRKEKTVGNENEK